MPLEPESLRGSRELDIGPGIGISTCEFSLQLCPLKGRVNVLICLSFKCPDCPAPPHPPKRCQSLALAEFPSIDLQGIWRPLCYCKDVGQEVCRSIFLGPNGLVTGVCVEGYRSHCVSTEA